MQSPLLQQTVHLFLQRLRIGIVDDRRIGAGLLRHSPASWADSRAARSRIGPAAAMGETGEANGTWRIDVDDPVRLIIPSRLEHHRGVEHDEVRLRIGQADVPSPPDIVFLYTGRLTLRGRFARAESAKTIRPIARRSSEPSGFRTRSPQRSTTFEYDSGWRSASCPRTSPSTTTPPRAAKHRAASRFPGPNGADQADHGFVAVLKHR